MIVYKDPDTGYMCKCSLAFSVPDSEGRLQGDPNFTTPVPFKEVPSHERDEFNEAITDYDVNGAPVLDVVKVAEVNRNKAKVTRDEALENLEHDFLDGRIMQVRPQDESNIRNAIEVINNNPITEIAWRMKDNTTATVTAAELTTALNAGQLAALSIWDTYNAS